MKSEQVDGKVAAYLTRLMRILKALYPGASFDQIKSKYPEFGVLCDVRTLKRSFSEARPLMGRAKFTVAQEISSVAFGYQDLLRSTTDRSTFGRFYTPTNELAPLYAKLDSTRSKGPHGTLLEPACGTGILTLGYLSHLGLNTPEWSWPTVEAFDIDQNAIAIARILMRATFSLFRGKNAEREFAKTVNIYSADLACLMPRPSSEVDIVLMNPPYASANLPAFRALRSEHGRGNLTNFFYSYVHKRLICGGQMLLVLGEPVRWGHSYRAMIDSMNHEYDTHHYLGSLSKFQDIRYETFATLLKKRSKPLHSGDSVAKFASQVRTYNPLLSRQDFEIWKHVHSKSVPMATLLNECTRGSYLPAHRITRGTTAFVKSGKDINCYTINKVNFVKLPTDVWKTIFNEERILLKAKRGKLAHAVRCPAGIATTDNVINIHPDRKQIPLPSLLGIINSAYFSYFLNTFIFCNNSESARIIDRVYLDRVLIPSLGIEALDRIGKLVSRIEGEAKRNKQDGARLWHLEIGRDHHKVTATLKEAPLNRIYGEIDDIIFSFLKLPEALEKYIRQNFGRVLHKIPTKERRIA